jgi:hypothetical protein
MSATVGGVPLPAQRSGVGSAIRQLVTGRTADSLRSLAVAPLVVTLSHTGKRGFAAKVLT